MEVFATQQNGIQVLLFVFTGDQAWKGEMIAKAVPSARVVTGT